MINSNMQNRMKYVQIQMSLALLMTTLAFSGCYYDNKEDLYQFIQTACDTSAVSYSQQVLPFLQAQCLGCHNARDQQGNVDLEGYERVIHYVNNGSLYGSVAHEPGFSPMPPTGQQVADCDLQHLRLWIDAGAKND